MSQYQRFKFHEREEVSRGLAAGLSLRAIAFDLKRSPSTISREILRTAKTKHGYRALIAQRYANHLAHYPRKKHKINTNEQLKTFIFNQLHKCWSPEQIAKRLKLLYPNDMTMHISHETIYAYLYVLPRGNLRRELIAFLRRQHKFRRQRNKARQKSYPIKDFISIEQRPSDVAKRLIPGHWEGDIIMGHANASALGTLVERLSRLILLVYLKNKDAISVRKAYERLFNRLPPHLKLSLTYDHGQEMAQHRLFTRNTRIRVYFAHPHAPWERGTNENTNGLIREFFPKGTDFSTVTTKDIKQVQNLLNDRPRRTLNFLTPHEVFSKLLH